MKILLILALAFVPAVARADMPKGSDTRTARTAVSGKTDFETITMMLEYNRRMVSKIDSYLKDRSKIPADYQAAADKEFLRKARMERMTVKKSDEKKSGK